MKELEFNIDFSDSSYVSCEANDKALIIYVSSWNNQTIKIEFSNVIEFLYRGGSFISGIYQKTAETSLLKEALTLYYDKIPLSHPFKTFVVLDIEDVAFFEVVAEEITVSKI